MRKKDYQKPTMNIVKLQHHCHILAGSVEASGLNDPDDYNDGGDPFTY